MGSCGVGGGRGAGFGAGFGEGVGPPMMPSASQLALEVRRGVGVAPSMPSSVRVIRDGVASDSPDTTDDPCQTSTRSKSEPLSFALEPTGLSISPMFAACAIVTWMILFGVARTSNAFASERAMTRMRATEEAIMTIRCVTAMLATSRCLSMETGEEVEVHDVGMLPRHGGAMRVSSPRNAETRPEVHDLLPWCIINVYQFVEIRGT